MRERGAFPTVEKIFRSRRVGGLCEQFEPSTGGETLCVSFTNAIAHTEREGAWNGRPRRDALLAIRSQHEVFSFRHNHLRATSMWGFTRLMAEHLRVGLPRASGHVERERERERERVGDPPVSTRASTCRAWAHQLASFPTPACAPPVASRVPQAPPTPPGLDALRGKPCNSRAKLTGESLKAETKTQCVETSLLTLQNPHAHTRTNTNARTLTHQHGSHRQRRRNDATELCSC
jgi:hypothetical protein